MHKAKIMRAKTPSITTLQQAHVVRVLPLDTVYKYQYFLPPVFKQFASLHVSRGTGKSARVSHVEYSTASV